MNSVRDPGILNRLRQALDSENPTDALERVVIALKNEGIGRRDAFGYLSELRKTVKGEAAKEDAVLEVMDFVYGFCSPGKRIWETDEPLDQ